VDAVLQPADQPCVFGRLSLKSRRRGLQTALSSRSLLTSTCLVLSRATLLAHAAMLSGCETSSSLIVSSCGYCCASCERSGASLALRVVAITVLPRDSSFSTSPRPMPLRGGEGAQDCGPCNVLVPLIRLATSHWHCIVDAASHGRGRPAISRPEAAHLEPPVTMQLFPCSIGKALLCKRLQVVGSLQSCSVVSLGGVSDGVAGWCHPCPPASPLPH
jgi:hypothetical protein